MVLLAHAADWIALISFVPVVGFLAWLGIAQLRERRQLRRDERG